MRLLVVHAWLRGNLGDVLQLSVLLSSLRELQPETLDLAGFPPQPAPETQEVLGLADRYVADPFLWYWKGVPRALRRAALERPWKARRRTLFSAYDAIVCAPGPYLAGYDARAASALCDIDVARELGLPVVLSSHSIGPLDPPDLAVVARATARIAREPATCVYLGQHAIRSFQSADLAFLYPYAASASPAAVPESPYRLVFLRSNNVNGRALRLEGGALFEGPRLIAEAAPEPLVLATSDRRRDGDFLAAVARRLGVRWVGCRTVAELSQLVAGSTSVVSDRYHPAICAAVLGRTARVLPNREPHKMKGLTDFLSDRPLEELQALARAGLATLHEALRGAA